MGVAAQVKRSYQVPLVLIVDNALDSLQQTDGRLAQASCTRVFNDFVFSPAYSPELNRIEMVWKQMKHNWRDFKVMPGRLNRALVGQISKGFG